MTDLETSAQIVTWRGVRVQIDTGASAGEAKGAINAPRAGGGAGAGAHTGSIPPQGPLSFGSLSAPRTHPGGRKGTRGIRFHCPPLWVRERP